MNTDPKQTQMIPAAELELAEYNPRKFTTKRLRRLAESLKDDPELFLSRPCLVNKRDDGRLVIYAGLMRYRAATEILKMTEIPCKVAEIEVSREVKRNVSDNTHAGSFDTDAIMDLNLDNDEMRLLFMDEFMFEDAQSKAEEKVRGGTVQAVTYQILITCPDETNQTVLLKELLERGIDVQATSRRKRKVLLASKP